MAPMVSVLMATHNRAHFLPTAIDSVLAQDMTDLEVVISDNASTDATPEIAQRYARKDGRVRYYRNDVDVGATANFNLCYQRSDPSSKYFALLPDDDWWEHTFLARLVSLGEAHESAAFIHSNAFRVNVNGRVLNKYSDLWQHVPPPGVHRAVKELYEGDCILILATLFNRKNCERIYPTDELFDPQLALTPDYHLLLQLLTRGARAYYYPECLMYFRKHQDAMTMPANVIPRLYEEVSIFRDKLEGVCPPELEDLRRRALANRILALGFSLLGAGRAREARPMLHEAYRRSSVPGLDLTVARIISALPLSKGLHTRLWRLAVTTSRTIKGTPRRQLT